MSATSTNSVNSTNSMNSVNSTNRAIVTPQPLNGKSSVWGTDPTTPLWRPPKTATTLYPSTSKHEQHE